MVLPSMSRGVKRSVEKEEFSNSKRSAGIPRAKMLESLRCFFTLLHLQWRGVRVLSDFWLIGAHGHWTEVLIERVRLQLLAVVRKLVALVLLKPWRRIGGQPVARRAMSTETQFTPRHHARTRSTMWGPSARREKQEKLGASFLTRSTCCQAQRSASTAAPTRSVHHSTQYFYDPISTVLQ